MNTITLPDGYNGHTVECDATPIAEDGNMVKLRVTGSSYLFTWVRRADWEAKKGKMTAQHTPGPWRIGDAGYTVFGPPNGNPSPESSPLP